MLVITRITYAEYLRELIKLYNTLCDSITEKDVPWYTDFCYGYISFSDIVEEVIGTDEYSDMVKNSTPYEVELQVNSLLVNRIANDLDKQLGTDKFNLIPCSQFETIMAFRAQNPYIEKPWDAILFGIGITAYNDNLKQWSGYES